MNDYHPYKKSINKVLEDYKTSRNGLSFGEAENRINKFGTNELPKPKKESIIKLFFVQFTSPIVILLIAACVFSFIIGEHIDGYAIIFIVLLDAVVGTIQEWKANKSAEALESMIKHVVKVKRNDKILEIDSSLLVQGDIMILEPGNKVCADGRIIMCNNLTIDESIISGESTASIKNTKIIDSYVNLSDMVNMVFAGSSVIAGRCEVVVTSVGANTVIGEIATNVYSSKSEKSPLMIRMDKFSKQISLLIVFIAFILIAILMYQDIPTSEIFLSVVALSVSCMPEGLPLALTLALTIGSTKMSKKNVIVKKLNSVESLGSCTVIATDKTGTLTVNEQTAKKIVLPGGEIYDVTGSGYNNEGVLVTNGFRANEVLEISRLGVLNNEAGLIYESEEWKHFGDSIDVAFLSLGLKLNIDISKINKYGDIPYESINKYSGVFFESDNKYYSSIKGSFETVLNYCKKMNVKGKTKKIDISALSKINDDLASQGYRVIAIASGEISNLKRKEYYNEKDIPPLTFLGFVAFIDPIRKEVKKAISNCISSGIKVIMITGDHPLTAYSIAHELKLASNLDQITSGEEIDKYLNLGDEDFDKFVDTIKVFTRVSPIQKLKIVESFKRQGEFVAVTGDGVNDAPAIKAANIGISMGSGSDVAKETSSVILIDDNFTSIVSAIKEGRIAYSNIRKVVYLLLSCGVAEVLFFILSIVFNYPMPLVAIQLLWLNIVTDGLQDLALSFEREESNIMREKPRNPKEGIFDKLLKQEIFISGVFTGLIVFVFWVFLIKYFKVDVSVARGYVMALMVFIQNFHVLNCKSEKKSIFKCSFKNNKMIIFTIVLSIILQILVMEIPVLSKMLETTSIPVYQLFILVLLALPILLIMEIFKYIKAKK